VNGPAIVTTVPLYSPASAFASSVSTGAVPPVALDVIASLGHEASISFKAVSASTAPLKKSVIPFQKEPEPTSPGMMSEASKRTLVASFTNAATERSTSSPYQSRLESLWGDNAPPAASHPFTASPLVKYSMTAFTSGRSLNIAMMSPATRNGFPYASSIGGR